MLDDLVKTNIETGLTTKEVNERINKNLVNYNNQITTKSIKEIIFSNLLMSSV